MRSLFFSLNAIFIFRIKRLTSRMLPERDGQPVSADNSQFLTICPVLFASAKGRTVRSYTMGIQTGKESIMSSHIFRELLNAYFYFMVYAFGGWIVQGLYVGFKGRKFVNTGFFHGPYVPIFGFGCLLIIYVVDPISRNPFWVFFNTFWMTSVLEYVTSWYLQMRYHRLWWNYSDKFMNINGRVCLLNSTLYGLAGWFVTFVSQPLLAHLTSLIPTVVLGIIEAAYSVFFFSDVFSTIREMNRHKHYLEKLHENVQAARKEIGVSAEKKLREAQANLEMLHQTSRHIHGMVHQHLNTDYQESMDTLRRYIQDDQKGIMPKS